MEMGSTTCVAVSFDIVPLRSNAGMSTHSLHTRSGVPANLLRPRAAGRGTGHADGAAQADLLVLHDRARRDVRGAGVLLHATAFVPPSSAASSSTTTCAAMNPTNTRSTSGDILHSPEDQERQQSPWPDRSALHPCCDGQRSASCSTESNRLHSTCIELVTEEEQPAARTSDEAFG